MAAQFLQQSSEQQELQHTARACSVFGSKEQFKSKPMNSLLLRYLEKIVSMYVFMHHSNYIFFKRYSSSYYYSLYHSKSLFINAGHKDVTVFRVIITILVIRADMVSLLRLFLHLLLRCIYAS